MPQPGRWGQERRDHRFTDDEHVELTLKADRLFPGQQTEARKIRCKVLVAENELILIDDRFPGAPPVIYQRRR
jgi:hypothetical protein